MPKVSVIIPVYNVKAYFRKCLDSIINQTLKDIEIILIDDGSTDGCGDICEEYASNDDRIKVLHKVNEGLSCARNDGIEMATAPYIMFVDSDDWVESDFCEKPYIAAKDNNADLVIFQACTVKKGKIYKSDSSLHNGEIDSETAIKKCGYAVWNKLYKRELFNSIRYPEGMAYEDVAVTHKIVLLARRIVFLSDVLYYWVCREDSITHKKTLAHRRDNFRAAIIYYEDLKDYGIIADIYERVLCSSAIRYLAISYPNDDLLYRKAESIIDSLEGIPVTFNWKKRVLLITWKIDKRLFHFICKAMRQKDQQQYS